MNILDTIVLHKRKEIEEGKKVMSIADLESSPLFHQDRISLYESLKKQGSSGIIAEFKRKSPSKGIINAQAQVGLTTKGYQSAGAAGLSVLTDQEFFSGLNEDVNIARANTSLPILRKDFIIDEYQIVEARSIGADVILLIAACLTPEKILQFTEFAHSLDLEVLLEVHDKEELDRSLNNQVDLVGVNNRNLKDFSVNINTSLELGEHIPETMVKVAESGLSNPYEIVRLRDAGFQGFLMGQRFMETNDPGGACNDFITGLNQLIYQHSLKSNN